MICPPRLENVVGAANGLGRLLGVMQRLAEDHQVHALRFNRRVLQVAQPELQVLQVVLLRLGRAERDDLLRIVHGDDLLAAARQQFAQQALRPTPRSATTSGGRIRSSRCPNACQERPGP